MWPLKKLAHLRRKMRLQGVLGFAVPHLLRVSPPCVALSANEVEIRKIVGATFGKREAMVRFTETKSYRVATVVAHSFLRRMHRLTVLLAQVLSARS